MGVVESPGDPVRLPEATPTARRRTARLALAALAVAIVGLWLVPPIGMVLAAGVGPVLAPWGRRLGERVIVSVVAAAALVAAIFTVMSALGVTIAPLGWRVLITGLLVGEGLLLLRRRSAPVLPILRGDDAAGLVTGAALFLAIYAVYATADAPRTINGLLQWWAGGELPHDHSSHLPMFLQVMRAGGWDFSSLSPNLLFDVYPMLHAAMWSVGEWAAGVAPGTDGLELVRPYAAWSALTAAIGAATLTWAAGLAARALTRRRATPAIAAMAATLAASATGLWCVLGSMGSMADFAASNFLAGAGLTIGAATLTTRSRPAMVRVGWFALPLAALMGAYLYPTLAAGLVLPWLAVLLAVGRRHAKRLAAMLALTAACAVASLPALRAITGSSTAGPWGSITGGLPAFEYWPAVAMAAIVVVVLILGWRTPGRLTTAGLLGPLLAAIGLAAFFAVQSVLTNVPVGDSYYTNKAVYAVLLAALPLFCAVVGRWTAVRLVGVAPARRHLSLAVVVLVLVIAVAEVSTLTRRPGVGGGTVTAPAGVAALAARADAVTRQPVVGDVVVAAAVVPPADGFVTVTWIPVKRSVTGLRTEYVNLFAGRTANALRHDATLDFEHTNVPLDILLRTADPVQSLREFLRVLKGDRLTLVVPDKATAETLRPAVDEFGADHLRVVVAPSTD